MAEPLKPIKGKRLGLQATLSDLARTASGAADGLSGESTVGAPGRQALAALAAEVAQASAVDVERPAAEVADQAGPDGAGGELGTRRAPARLVADARSAGAAVVGGAPVMGGPVVGGPVVGGGPAEAGQPQTPRPRPLGGMVRPTPPGPLRPIGAAVPEADAPAVPKGAASGLGVGPRRLGATASSGTLPAPSGLTPGAIRLPSPTDHGPSQPDQPTIPLRRRVPTGGPVSISPSPPTPIETGSAGPHAGNGAPPSPSGFVRPAASSVPVVAWLPSDDDILPRRQMRRGRTFRRAR